jgi:hypothetical protein
MSVISQVGELEPDGNDGPKFGDLPNSKLLIAIGRLKITRG